MVTKLVTEDEFMELSILRKKIEAVLDCIVGGANTHDQTLTNIANDYLGEMGKMMQAVQTSRDLN